MTGARGAALSVRPLRLPDERGFLDDIVYLACTWYRSTPEHPHPSRDELLRDMAVYVEGWGRPGDVCLVADHDDRLIGGAFYRLFPQDRHGHGWIDQDIPELGMAVVDGYRGTGMGRALMTTLLAVARLEGHERISLHVSDGNVARDLYESVGFEPHRQMEGGCVMVRDLSAGR